MAGTNGSVLLPPTPTPTPTPSPGTGVIAVPTVLQLDWYEHDIGCMITWNAFSNCVEASDPDASALVCQTCDQAMGNKYRVVTPESMLARHYPRDFNVTAQVEAAASFGSSYIIFVVNQMVGFALWPTKANNYSISNTPFRGGDYDIMSEYVTACRRFGIKPGIFYTTKENNYNGIGKGAPIGPKNYTVAEQDAFIVTQLTELMLGKYGPIYELWLDGGLGAEYALTAAFLLKHGDKWLNHGFPARNGIRWVGNEDGVAGQPNWGGSDLVTNLDVKGRGDPYGNVFYPSSADCVLREHCWSWKPWGQMPSITSTRRLVSKYISSSGQGSKLMLNMAPMTFGGLNQDDKAAYAKLGAALRCLFRDPLVNQSFGGAPMAAIPGGGGWEQEWELDNSAGVAAPPVTTDFTLSIREDISSGQRIWSWRLLVSSSTSVGGWADVTTAATDAYTPGGGSSEARAVSIGFRRMFPNMSLPRAVVAPGGSAIRMKMKLVVINVTNSSRAPSLRDVAVHDWSARATDRCFDGVEVGRNEL